MFSLTEESKHKSFNGKKALCYDKDYLIRFDGNSKNGSCIGIVDQCDKQSSYSYSFIGNDYIPPTWIKPNTEAAYRYFTGSSDCTFKVIDFDTYKVIRK